MEDHTALWRRLDLPGHEVCRGLALPNGWQLSGEAAFAYERQACRLDGRKCFEVAGCTDIDLNFSPSTNLLPIRRLDLAIGQSAPVRAAWLRFPSFALEPLEQSYTRLDSHCYLYQSGGRFVTELDVDDAGLVTEYPDFWVREDAGTSGKDE